MGTISSGVGLISGINSGDIIDQLISLDSKPRTLLQNRITVNTSIKTAYADLQARLTSLLGTANLLVKPSTFQTASAVSSDTTTLGVTAQATAVPGQYQFTVARTVATQSMISAGFADSSTALVGAGTIRIGLGGGEVTSSTNLADLNGGNGIRRGLFRVIDKAGSSASIDISSAVSLEDVVKKINTASNLQVRASIGDQGLILEDTSGGAGALKVQDIGGGSTAADLGIASSTSGTALVGTSINTIGRNTSLASLNDGLGIRSKAGGPDFSVTVADGSTVNVSLSGKKSVGELLDALNTAGTGKFTASLRSDGLGFAINDSTTGATTFAVNALNGSKAAADLGLDVAPAGNVIQGSNVKATLGSVLTRNLKGGAGIGAGQISLTDRAGTQATVNLSGATTLSEVISRLNGTGIGITASLNRSGTGIDLKDTTGGTGNVIISDVSGASGAALGITGSFGLTTSTISGGSLDRQFISENTRNADLAGGKGLATGTFEITNAKGASATINTASLANGTLQDVIKAINDKGIGVTASINAKGNGLLLTDTTTGGTGKLTVKEVNGTAAASLNILGTATGNTIDGAYVKDIDVSATDTLQTLMAKVNKAGAGVSASIVNDGSNGNPYRLSVTANNTGLDGRFTFDAGSTGVGMDTLVKAQDAAVFLGSATTQSPVMLTSSSNTMNNVLSGISLNLATASEKPVTVTVTQTSDNAVTQLQAFTKTFNDLTAKVKELTKFNTDTNTKGLLLGDQTATSITDTLFQAINARIPGAGQYSLFSQIGLTIGADNQVSFNEEKFRAAYATDSTSVQRMFTAFNTVTTTAIQSSNGTQMSESTATTPFGTEPAGVVTTGNPDGTKTVKTTKLEGFGLGYMIQKAINKLIDPVNGTIILQNNNLDTANQFFTDRITQMTAQLNSKKARLQKQFADMESVLSKLQTQQSAIGKITSISLPT